MRSVVAQSKTITALLVFFIPFTAHAINFQGPLVVNDAYIKKHGNVIVGNFQGTLSAPAILVNTSNPVLITDSILQGPGDMIYGQGVNVSVTNTTGTATNTNIYGQQKGMFLHVEGAINVNAQNNTMTGFTFGIYINSYQGNGTNAQTIKILNNIVNNMDGRPSNGNGGYITSGQWNAHAFQLNQVRNVPYMEIAWNQIINQPNQGMCSDLINIYVSGGQSGNPLLIHDNYLQGAFPANPGPDNYTGGGIITDGGTSNTATNTTSFVNIYNNQMVATANYGLSIAAGHDNQIYNNRVVSSGYTASGAFYPTTFGNGINNYNNYNQPATTFYNNYASNNYSGLIRKNSTGGPMRADWYLPGQASGTGANVAFTPNNTSAPTLADEAAEYQLWLKKIAKQSKKLGSSL
jgi:hypothetical protein